jgi:hypothetical protein
MNPVATSDAAFRGGACPTPEYTIAYTGNYTTSADANASNRFLLSPSFIHLGCRYALRAMLSFLRLSRGLSCKPIT